MTSKEKKRILAIIEKTDAHYPVDIKCYLHFDTPWQLLFATILSAQCTDERVNLVTAELFQKYPTLEAVAGAEQKEFEKDIYSTGFYHNKAKNIIACANVLIEQYDGEVPSDIDALTKLPGVGRKTANVIRGEIFRQPSVVVDTHVGRLARRLGLSENEDPVRVEFDLMEVIPEDHWIAINRQWIAHGRAVCTSRKPKCAECFLQEECRYYKENEKPKKA